MKMNYSEIIIEELEQKIKWLERRKKVEPSWVVKSAINPDLKDLKKQLAEWKG